MNLYEADIGAIWWVAALDEFQAMETLRIELYEREIPDEEIDDIMEELSIRELDKEEASLISIVDEYGSRVSTLWEMYLNTWGGSCVVATTFDGDNELEYEKDDY